MAEKSKLTSLPQAALREQSIPIAAVAKASGVDRYTVDRVLDPAQAASCRRVSVRAVRNTVEQLLLAAQWPGDTSDLWAEFESTDSHAA